MLVMSGVLLSCDNNSSENKQIEPVTHISSAEKNENDSLSIASIGEGSISVEVLKYYMAQKGMGSTNKKITREDIDSVLDEMISLELYKQAAIKNKLDKEPSVVLAMSRFLSSKYQTDILAKNAKLTQVSNDEIKARFEKNKKQYATPARRRGAIISVRLSSKADKKEHKKAKEKLKKISSSATSLKKQQRFFGDLAKRYSDDIVSKSRQGDIGWVVQGASVSRYEPVVIKSLFSLDKVGDVSSVVKGERGYYLIKLVDSMPSVQQTLKQVKRKVHQELLAEKSHATELQITKDLKQQFKVKINDALMSDIIKKINTKNADTNNLPPSFPVAVKTK